MNYEDAINDPARPLSVPPNEWMQRRGSKNTPIESVKTSEEIVASVKTAKIEGESTGIEELDMGIDAIINGIEQMQAGFKKLDGVEMDESERAVINKAKDLIETAIAPYMADIVEELDKLEGAE